MLCLVIYPSRKYKKPINFPFSFAAVATSSINFLFPLLPFLEVITYNYLLVSCPCYLPSYSSPVILAVQELLCWSRCHKTDELLIQETLKGIVYVRRMKLHQSLHKHHFCFLPGQKERKPKSVRGRICRRQKLRQQ